MTSGEITERNFKGNGTADDAANPSNFADSSVMKSPDQRVAGVLAAVTDEVEQETTTRSLYVPTIEEIKSELWWIATGEGSESARVSALRALADIMGLMKPGRPDFPEGMTALLDALAEGLSSNS